MPIVLVLHIMKNINEIIRMLGCFFGGWGRGFKDSSS